MAPATRGKPIALISAAMPITVVLADDNPDHRLAVRLLLELAPDVAWLVGEAADGHQALELVRRERPDVVIADLVMPCVDGLELAALVKRERPYTKVIVVSGYGDFQAAAARSGADAYVSKHEIGTRLVPAVLEVVNRGP